MFGNGHRARNQVFAFNSNAKPVKAEVDGETVQIKPHSIYSKPHQPSGRRETMAARLRNCLLLVIAVLLPQPAIVSGAETDESAFFPKAFVDGMRPLIGESSASRTLSW